MQLIMDVVAENGVPFRVILDTDEDRDGEKGMVYFFDLRYPHTENGQFTGANYRYQTMMEHPRFAGLNLHGGVDNWTLDGDTFNLIFMWLRSFEF